MELPEATLLPFRLIAADCGLVGRHLLNQFRDPILGLLIADLKCQPLVMGDFTVKFTALVAPDMPCFVAGSSQPGHLFGIMRFLGDWFRPVG